MKLSIPIVVVNLMCLGSALSQPVWAEDAPAKTPQRGVVSNSQLEKRGSPPLPQDDIRLIHLKNDLQDAGRLFEKQGRLEQALSKYREADEIVRQMWGWQRPKASTLTIRILHKQGKYEQAVEELDYVISTIADPGSSIEHKLELQALIRARDTGSPEPIYEHIRYLREKYRDQLPPRRCLGLCDTIFTTIVRLYDHIGDVDSGIALVEEFLKYYAKLGPGNPYQAGNQYFQIKQAFEEDKKQGTHGRATQALIESDYFPW